MLNKQLLTKWLGSHLLVVLIANYEWLKLVKEMDELTREMRKLARAQRRSQATSSEKQLVVRMIEAPSRSDGMCFQSFQNSQRYPKKDTINIPGYFNLNC